MIENIDINEFKQQFNLKAIEEAKQKFINSIKNIPDEKIQELIDYYVAENQDKPIILFRFFVDTPAFGIKYKQCHDIDAEQEIYESADVYESMEFDDFIEISEKEDNTVWRKIDIEKLYYDKRYMLISMCINLSQSEIEDNGYQTTFCYDTVLGGKLYGEDKEHYQMITTTINSILKDFGYEPVKMNEYGIFDYDLFLNVSVNQNEIKDILQERLIEFGIDVISAKVTEVAPETFIHIKIKNPQLQ